MAQRTRVLAAGAAYGFAAFAIGFALGAARVTLVAPRLGELSGVLIELPIILTLTWFVSGWVMRRLGGAVGMAGAAMIGGLALAVLLGCEYALAAALGRSLQAFLAAMATPAGLVGLAGQVMFACFPALRVALRR